MGTPTDPETYLRLACERMLFSVAHGRGRPPAEPAMAGRALAAAGVIDEQKVRSVLQEYMLALQLRENGQHLPRFFMAAQVRGNLRPLPASRVVVGDFAVGGAGEQLLLHNVIFSDEATRLELSGLPQPSAVRKGARHGPLPHLRRAPFFNPGHAPQGLAVQDDQGLKATASQHHVGQGARAWEGTFVTDKALSPTTAWLEIEGARVDLPPPSPPLEASVEGLGALPPLKAALYAELTAMLTSHGGENSIEDAKRALLETGAVQLGDPVLAEVEAIAAGISGSGPPPNVGPPWSFLFRRWGSSDGPTGTVAIGAAVGPVEGYSVRFDLLCSDAQGFSLEVATSPGDAMGHAMPWPRLGLPPLQWWAEDDLQNLYLGTENGHSSSPDFSAGTLRFGGPLDPRAKVLRLLPTGKRQRGVVVVPLDALKGK